MVRLLPPNKEVLINKGVTPTEGTSTFYKDEVTETRTDAVNEIGCLHRHLPSHTVRLVSDTPHRTRRRPERTRNWKTTLLPNGLHHRGTEGVTP